MSKLAISAAALLAGSLFLSAPGVAEACPSTGLDGNYATLFTGWSSGARVSVTGFLDANGSGALSGSLTVDVGGVTRTRTFSGSYTANSCSGSATMTLSNGNVINFNFYVNRSGKAFVGTETDGGSIVTVRGHF